MAARQRCGEPRRRRHAALHSSSTLVCLSPGRGRFACVRAGGSTWTTWARACRWGPLPGWARQGACGWLGCLQTWRWPTRSQLAGPGNRQACWLPPGLRSSDLLASCPCQPSGPACFLPRRAGAARRRVVRGLPHHHAEPAGRAGCGGAVPHAAPHQPGTLRGWAAGALAVPLAGPLAGPRGTGSLALFVNQRCAPQHTQPCPCPWLRSRPPASSPPAAWLRFGAGAPQLCCCSPERFLRGDRGGVLEAKPIKGTAPRFPADPQADARSAAELAGGCRLGSPPPTPLAAHGSAAGQCGGSQRARPCPPEADSVAAMPLTYRKLTAAASPGCCLLPRSF